MTRAIILITLILATMVSKSNYLLKFPDGHVVNFSYLTMEETQSLVQSGVFTVKTFENEVQPSYVNKENGTCLYLLHDGRAILLKSKEDLKRIQEKAVILQYEGTDSLYPYIHIEEEEINFLLKNKNYIENKELSQIHGAYSKVLIFEDHSVLVLEQDVFGEYFTSVYDYYFNFEKILKNKPIKAIIFNSK